MPTIGSAVTVSLSWCFSPLLKPVADTELQGTNNKGDETARTRRQNKHKKTGTSTTKTEQQSGNKQTEIKTDETDRINKTKHAK